MNKKALIAYLVVFLSFLALIALAGRYPQAFAVLGVFFVLWFVNMLVAWITGVDCEAGFRKAIFRPTDRQR